MEGKDCSFVLIYIYIILLDKSIELSNGRRQ